MMAWSFLFFLMATFVSLNVNGLRDAGKREAFLQWLSHFSADFVSLQETHVTSFQECRSWFSAMGFSSLASFGSVHSCGSVILYKPTYTLVRSWSDDDGRFIMGEFLFHGVTFRVVCLYAPNRNPEREQFYEYCTNRIDPAVPTVLCGDFNAVFDRAADRRGSESVVGARESCEALSAFFRECCVVDTWRVKHPTSRCFSWMRPDGSQASRIDFIGCPYSWVHHIVSCDMFPYPFSDHCTVVLKVPVPEPLPRGPGRWFFNVALLKEPVFVSSVVSFWRRWQGEKASFPSLLRWWELGKEKIKSLAIYFCSRKSKSKASSYDLLSVSSSQTANRCGSRFSFAHL